MDACLRNNAPGEENTAAGLPPLPEAKEWEEGGVRKVSLWPRLVALASGKNTLALAGQAVVSGTNFLTTVLVGRCCTTEELGIYSLGFSLLVTWAGVQEALVTLPYTISWRRSALRDTRKEDAGSALAQHGLLSGLALLVLAGGALLLSWSGTVPGLAAVTWALAAVLPFVLLREFGRRFAFAHLRMGTALGLDVSRAAVQLTGLAWLAAAGQLSAVTTVATTGAACALTGLVWLYLVRGDFVLCTRRLWPAIRQGWSLGKWLLPSQLSLYFLGYFIYWLLAWVLGPTATGVYVACLTVVQFSSPFLQGISNGLIPQATQAFIEGGDRALRHLIGKATLLIGTTMVLFCVVVVVCCEDLMGLIYSGSQYHGHGHTVAVLTVAMLIGALGMPAGIGLAVVKRPDLTFKVGGVAVVVTVVLVPCLVCWWDVTGAAYGFLAGNVVGAVGRWAAFAARADGRPQGKRQASRTDEVLQE